MIINSVTKVPSPPYLTGTEEACSCEPGKKMGVKSQTHNSRLGASRGTAMRNQEK
jgi:hypothetical protein